MEYEKKYKDALERASKLRVQNPFDTVSQMMEHVFPELKESEDERIRKSLIDFFDSANQVGENPMYEYGIQTDKIIKYLEKQVSPNMVADAYLRGCNDTEKKWLEKEGESDETKAKIFLINKGYPIDTNGIFPTYDEMYNIIREGLETQGEHKSIDKVEPKFHEGEWVVFNNKHQSIYQVEKIENGYYILRHTHGGSFRVCVLHDESLRLWTINDAKDGDVLVIEKTKTTYETIFIFKEIEDTHIIHYVYYLNTGIEQVFEKRSANGFVGFIDEVVHPATKEQRDTLLKAIKDAGYEFDFMKKELKEVVEPKFKVGYTIVPKHNPTTNKIYFTITDIIGGKYWYNDRIICDIAEQDEWEVLEQKSAWSEEDDYYRDNLITWLNCGAVRVDLRKDFIDWLKSLKQRINKE